MKNRKILIILLITLGLLFITTGTVSYYRYSVNGKINATAGNYTFNVSSSSTTTKEINLGSNLKPYDKGSFNLTVNLDDTDSDAYYSVKISRNHLPNGFKFLSKDDNISPFSTYSKYFKASDSKTDTITVYWYWDGNSDSNDDNSFINKNISADVIIDSFQSNPAYMKNGSAKFGQNGTEFWSDNYRSYIKTITFQNNLSNLPNTCNEENLCWDITESGLKKVYGYLIDTGLKDGSNNSLYNLYIVSDSRIYAPDNCSFMFSNFPNLVKIDFNNLFYTSNSTKLNSMFKLCSSLESLDLSNFDTMNVTNMNSFLSDCSMLNEINLSNFNTAKVTDMGYLFFGCSSIVNLDLSNFNTANVTNMRAMFEGCIKLITLNINGFNTVNVTDMQEMFINCSSLSTTLYIGNNTVSSYNGMFSGASTKVGSVIMVNYMVGANQLVDNMIATKSENSNVIKGKQI